MDDFERYEKDLDEYAKEQRKKESSQKKGYNDPFGYEEGFIDGDMFSDVLGDGESNESKFFKGSDKKSLEKIKEVSNHYWNEPDKKATLHKFGSVKIRKKTEVDLQILFGLLNKRKLEGLAYLFVKQDKKTAYIYDIYVPKQSVSGGSCDPDPKALVNWMIKNRDNPKKNDLMGWAHSHSDMGCFWSTTDDYYVKSLINGFDLAKPKMLFSLVYSFAGKNVKKLSRFDINSLFGRITVDDIDIETVDEDKWDKSKWNKYIQKKKKYFKKIIKSKIKEERWTSVTVVEVDEDEKKKVKGKKNIEEISEEVDLYVEDEHQQTGYGRFNYPGYVDDFNPRKRNNGRFVDDDERYDPYESSGWYR